jgi:CRP/FNR family transcriptional regulator
VIGYDPEHTGLAGAPCIGDAETKDLPATETELGRAEFFRALTAERLATIRHLILVKRFRRQAVLFFEAEPAEYLWVVKSGEVRLYKSSATGRVTTLEAVNLGEMFGAVSSLDKDRYSTSAEAVTDGAAWCLPRKTMMKLVAEEPATAVDILVAVSRRLRDAHDRLRSFASDPAPARLARALLRAAREGEARVTRRELAEASGTTVETAIRVLRRFEKDGLITGEVGRIHVIDGGALQRIAGDR